MVNALGTVLARRTTVAMVARSDIMLSGQESVGAPSYAYNILGYQG